MLISEIKIKTTNNMAKYIAISGFYMISASMFIFDYEKRDVKKEILTRENIINKLLMNTLGIVPEKKLKYKHPKEGKINIKCENMDKIPLKVY